MIDPAHILTTASHDTLASVLSYERRLLEQLLFRHTELAMLLEAGEHRFIGRALDEVNEVESELGATEVIRAAVVEALVPDLPDPTIEDVLRRAPAESRPLLDSLTLDLRRLHDGIEERRHTARSSATRKGQLASAAQANVNAGGYRSDGSAVPGA